MRAFGPRSPPAVGSATTSVAINVRNAVKLSVSVDGTFVATYDVEGSIDGTNWKKLNIGNTAPQLFDFVTPIDWVRISVTAWTSGSLTMSVSGRGNP